MLPISSCIPPSSKQEPPFLIRVEHRDVKPNGDFRPAAHVSFAAPLRLSGLLNALPPEAAKDLLMLLTFITANGLCSPTVRQIAEAMRISNGKARARLERLLAFRWQGEPLLVHQHTQSGLEVFAPRPWLAPVREDVAPLAGQPAQAPLQAAPREAIIAHTRATYARPRAEVEREIEEGMGYGRDRQGRLHRMPVGAMPGLVPQAPEAAAFSAEERAAERAARREREEVREQLLKAGLQSEQAEALLAGYDLLRIRRQLMWLPYRKAKNSAGMLLASIKDDYEAPPALWRSPALYAAASEPSEEPEGIPEEGASEEGASADGEERAVPDESREIILPLP
jgi:hypothetical protein